MSAGFPLPNDDVRRLHESNRAAWNQGAAGYTEFIEGESGAIRLGEYSTLKPVEIEQIGDLHGRCARAIHLQCASGADTLSLLNLGADEVIGVDISDGHIENARVKSAQLGANAQWFRCDLLDTPHELDGTADLVYTGKGAIIWMMDLPGWAAVVARLLKPGGRFYLFEQHPITWVFQEDADRYEIHPEWSYFRQQPDVNAGFGEQYLGDMGKEKGELATNYARLWPVSTVINTLINAGLRLERFSEMPTFPYSYNPFPRMAPEQVTVLPQSYSLLMRRPESAPTPRDPRP